MSWEFDLRDEVELISPNNNFHYAKWRENDRSFEKKLGIFSPPNFKGEIVQDMGVKATLWPLTLYFTGKDGPYPSFGNNHHKDAEKFYKSCREEVGQWEITHPVRGALVLQLVSYTEKMNPVENGSFTIVETSWIEPANVERIVSLDSTLLSMLLSAASFILDAIDTFKQIRADAYASLASVAGTLNKIANLADNILKQISATDALAQESYNTLRAAFNNAIDNFGIDDPDPTAAAEALAEMVATPVEASEDFGTSFSFYNDSINSFAGLAPTGVTEQDYNTVLSQEFGINTALAAIVKLISVSTFSSRADIVSAMDNLTNLFTSTVAILDGVQENFSDNELSKQYFSLSKSYTSLVEMFSLAMQYLISQFYNLKVEKRFTLKNRMAVLDLVIQEHGDVGNTDITPFGENYDIFISSNHLSGNDIIILPAGREVVIYV